MKKINLNEFTTIIGKDYSEAYITKADLLRAVLPILQEMEFDGFFEWNEGNADPQKVDVENYLVYLEHLLNTK